MDRNGQQSEQNKPFNLNLNQMENSLICGTSDTMFDNWQLATTVF